MVQLGDFRKSMESMVDGIMVFVAEKPMNCQTERELSFGRLKRPAAVQVGKNEFRIA